MQPRPRVAVLGAGASGASVAEVLSSTGKFNIHVFEKGRGVGGRAATRRVEKFHRCRDLDLDRPGSGGISPVDGGVKSIRFDHGLQYIPKAKTAEFRFILRRWAEAGVVEAWTGKMGTLNPGNGRMERKPAEDRFVRESFFARDLSFLRVL